MLNRRNQGYIINIRFKAKETLKRNSVIMTVHSSERCTNLVERRDSKQPAYASPSSGPFYVRNLQQILPM